jgi:hypothetical protein
MTSIDRNGISSGVEAVMASLGDHLVSHSVSDPFEEDLVGPCSDAGDGLALDRPTDHLGEGGAGASLKRATRC